MAQFGTEIFARLANEVKFKRPNRIDKDLRPVDPGCFIAGRILPKPVAQGSLAGRNLTQEEDVHNFKEALFALVMMRAKEDIERKLKARPPVRDKAEVSLNITFVPGSVHPEAKRLGMVAGSDRLDRTLGQGVDTIVADLTAGPDPDSDEVYNLISLISLGYIALACN